MSREVTVEIDGKTYRGWWAHLGRIGITVSYMGSDARFGSRTAQPIGHNAALTARLLLRELVRELG
jgi:hypothetical protein